MATMNFSDVDIHQLGETGFRIERDGFVIYLDPSEIESDAKKADVVLLTDNRRFLSKEVMSEIMRDDTLLLAAPSVMDDDFSEMAAADFINQRGVEIRGVPGTNGEDLGVGFLITMNDTKLYHPGNTNGLPGVVDLRSEGVDVLLLPEENTPELVNSVMPKSIAPLNGSAKNLIKKIGSEIRIL